MKNRLPSFPTVQWKREMATFVAADTPNDAPAPAALVFPFYGDRVVLANITTRGWCIPSGHIEEGESFEEAVRREAFEEAGITLGHVQSLGYFILTDTAGLVRYAPTFIGEVRGIGSIPEGSESEGMQMVAVEDVASFYFAWDSLLAAVFTYAEAQRIESFSSGILLSDLMKPTS